MQCLCVGVLPLASAGAALGLCLDLGPGLPGRGLYLLLVPPHGSRYSDTSCVIIIAAEKEVCSEEILEYIAILLHAWLDHSPLH